jgi:uncharacterized repeat protein (TIGR03803 family)
MRSKKPLSAGKATFTIFIALLLASAIVPTQAQAQKFKVLHTFHGSNGAEPLGGLVRDNAGNIYGTTAVGGTGNCTGGTGCGTAFKLDKTGKQIWLYKFNGRNGDIPYSELLRDSSGNLLGLAGGGGDLGCNPPYGCGTVFRLDGRGKKERVLHKFAGPPGDGQGPYGSLVKDGLGNAYGATSESGSDSQGTVFEIDTSGKESILHTFAGPPNGGGDGSGPEGGVIRDSAGNLYGVTFQGGAFGAGAVYEVSSGGEETLLYSFSGGSDGAQPSSALLLDSQGNLYGTTQNGGNGQCGGTGCGVVFELSPQSGGGWTEKVLYDFCSVRGCEDGEGPFEGPLVMDTARNLYGTTYFGGAHRNCNGEGCGVVFKLGPDGKETVLHSFTGGADGALPVAGVILDSSNNLHGTTQQGGDLKCQPKFGCGVVFKVSP